MHIRIDGSLDYRQTKQHIPHAFTVPHGTTQLAIRFDYAPMQSAGQSLPNDLSLTLFDPEGARGARHCNPDRNLVLSAVAATPGYVPGPLQPGVWTVWIDTHRILPSDTLHYFFDIELSDASLEGPAPDWQKGTVAARGPGWYRGDLHGHTFHSDAHWDVPDFVQYARDYKLDFVTLTDHNTVSPLAQLDSLAADDLLTMGGVELTTYYGHALALGTRQWMEWRTGLNGLDMPMLAEQVMASGATFVIAHPSSVGDPACTGCDWSYPDMMPGNARRVEIWNGPWAGDSNNEPSLRLWYSWLNEGYRMVGTAGTDIHGPLTDPRPGFNIVYADDLREAAILDGIARGHSYVSSGPRLELTAQNEQNDQAMMGDLIEGEHIVFSATWEGGTEGDCLRVIVNGEAREEIPFNGSGKHIWTLLSTGADAARWCALEVRNAAGELASVTNPVFMGTPQNWR